MTKFLPVLQQMSNKSRAASYTKEDAKTDCSYCRAPCCQLLVVLNDNEYSNYEHDIKLVDGVNRHVLKRNEDDYCVYYVHGSGCSTYNDKPSVCDYYTCRTDKRITPSHKYGPIRPIYR